MLLTARNLHKIYRNGAKQLHVIKGINLKVRKGEILTIVGHSGAGKSTLLHLLGGLDRPNEGEVSLDGVNLYKVSEAKRARIRNRRIGFVFQFYHLLPEFTAAENIMLPALVRRGTSKGDLMERTRGLLTELGLEDRGHHRPGELSGGEQQRVAIARALINEPEIIFCDEPTGNLDSVTGSSICELIRRLNREKGQTFVVVTHEREIAEGANRVLQIRDGVLVDQK